MDFNVIVLPSSKVEAVTRFQECLQMPGILVVAYGDGRAEKALVDTGKYMMGGEMDPARLVWAKQPAHIAEQVRALANPREFDLTARSVAALGIAAAPSGETVSREVRDVVLEEECRNHVPEDGVVYVRLIGLLAKVAGQ